MLNSISWCFKTFFMCTFKVTFIKFLFAWPVQYCLLMAGWPCLLSIRSAFWHETFSLCVFYVIMFRCVTKAASASASEIGLRGSLQTYFSVCRAKDKPLAFKGAYQFRLISIPAQILTSFNLPIVSTILPKPPFYIPLIISTPVLITVNLHCLFHWT